MNEDANIEIVAAPDQPMGPDKRWVAPFFTIWIGQALSLVGSQVGGFALVWWLTKASGGSATVLATMTLIALLPQVLLGPFAGALVDRWNRRRVMIVADSLIALFSAGLAVLAWLDVLQIWHVYVIMFVRALGGTFHFAAMQASTSLMVPKSQLARIGGMNQTLRGVLDIITPPLGALLLEVLPLYGIMGLDVVTAAFAVGPLLFIAIPQPRREGMPAAADGTSPVVTLWRDVVGGISYIWHWTGLFIVLLMATALNMTFNSGFSLLPILVNKHFLAGALELGWLNSAWGIGVVAGGLTLSVWGGFRRKIHTSILGLIGTGIGVILVGVASQRGFWLAWAGILLAGFMNPIVNAPFMALLQSAVAPEIQGRVFTAVSSLAGLASPLGMMIAGPVADRAGVQVWFLIGGLVSILMGSAMCFIPAVLQLEDEAGRREKQNSLASL
ncbi:MAG TPA: MFS transporter [Anaerolineae bacterium]|nr:MFS transporter [Anaerolineae bacterium]HQK14943.1 MFS transporter [Anaerolineae bacterium]